MNCTVTARIFHIYIYIMFFKFNEYCISLIFSLKLIYHVHYYTGTRIHTHTCRKFIFQLSLSGITFLTVFFIRIYV